MKRWTMALRFIGIGWFIGISILLGVLGGLWLDNTFNSGPLFVIIGLVLGFAVAGGGVYRMLQPFINNRNNGTKGNG